MGMVCEDGRELYFEVDHSHVELSQWVKDHVVPYLTWEPHKRITQSEAGQRILDFLRDDSNPEFWANFAAYDWICVCQSFGTMMDLPSHFPKFCLDIQQFWTNKCGKPHKSTVRPDKPANQHNALADAQWNLAYWKNLQTYYGGLLQQIAETGKIPKALLR